MNPWVYKELSLDQQHLSDFVELCVSDTVLGVKGLATVCKILRSTPRLSKLRVTTKKSLPAKSISRFAQNFPAQLETLTIQDLGNNNCLMPLIAGISPTTGLRSLSLIGLTISEQLCKQLYDYVPLWPHLQQLKLFDAFGQTTTPPPSILWRVFSQCPHLTELRLSSIYFCDHSWQLLCEVLPGCLVLENLYLSSNECISDASAKMLAKTLPLIPNLRQFEKYFMINNIGLIALFQALPLCPKIFRFSPGNFLDSRPPFVAPVALECIKQCATLLESSIYFLTGSKVVQEEIDIMLAERRVAAKTRQRLLLLIVGLQRRRRLHPRLPPELYFMIDEYF